MDTNNELNIIESKEFTSLLEAIEIMAKAQGDLSYLTKAVTELRSMVDNGLDTLPVRDESIINGIIETMQNLVDDLSEDENINI